MGKRTIGCFGKITQTLGLLGGGWMLASCGIAANLWLGTDPTDGQGRQDAALQDPSAPEALPLAVDPAPPAAEPSPEPQKQPDRFREAVNRASSAVVIGQSAQSASDWELAASRWQQAIALMQQVPSHSPNHGQAQAKVQEYQQHLAAAQAQASREPVTSQPTTAPVAASQPANGLVAQVPIQRRQGGTPVVAVTLHGQRGGKTFPMLFDTGATATLITAEMAQAAGVVVVGETRARIADGSVVTLPVGYVDAIELGGLRKASVRVAIGGSYGLLGQDIYGEYGIAIGSHQINLHQ